MIKVELDNAIPVTPASIKGMVEDQLDGMIKNNLLLGMYFRGRTIEVQP
jgi:hypothetical protein